MIYKLILWTLACTSLDGIDECPAGDYTVHDAQWTAKEACTQSLQALTWVSLDKDRNRFACIRKDALEALERVEQL